MSYDTELAFAKDLALEAGGIMRHYFRAEDIGTTWKEDNSPLTVADNAVNDMVIERVKDKFPDDGVLGEESCYMPERQRVWVVDPIDGTVPFSLGMPLSTFLLALVDRKDGQPVVAVVYDPYLDHLYSATKGGGAFLGGKRLESSKSMKLFRTYISVYGPPTKDRDINYQPGWVSDKLREKSVRNMVFASGAYTASKIAEGNFAALLAGAPASPWDFAAICLLVQEAGGFVTDLEGKPRRFDSYGFGCVMAANKTILDEVLKLAKGLR